MALLKTFAIGSLQRSMPL
eukprot:Gb_22749 [translate_table: standard]